MVTLFFRGNCLLQGLDTLKNEHHQILNSLLSSVKTIKKENGDTNLVEEKSGILKKSLEMLDLGLGEAQVSDGERDEVSMEKKHALLSGTDCTIQ